MAWESGRPLLTIPCSRPHCGRPLDYRDGRWVHLRPEGWQVACADANGNRLGTQAAPPGAGALRVAVFHRGANGEPLRGFLTAPDIEHRLLTLDPDSGRLHQLYRWADGSWTGTCTDHATDTTEVTTYTQRPEHDPRVLLVRMPSHVAAVFVEAMALPGWWSALHHEPAHTCVTCGGAGRLGPATDAPLRDYGRACPTCGGAPTAPAAAE